MRTRLAQAAVFVTVFCLFLGYCRWWKARSPEAEGEALRNVNFDAFVVSGAGDGTFNGLYASRPREDPYCFIKDDPRRYLWCDAEGWHLTTTPGVPGDGYVMAWQEPTEEAWSADGAPAPAPLLRVVPAPAEATEADTEVTPSPPGSYPAHPADNRATSPG